MKKLISAFGILLVAAAFASMAFAYSMPSFDSRVPKIIGGDKDIHGCYIAAGYQWCESKHKCIRPWEESCPATKAWTFQPWILVLKSASSVWYR